MNALREECQQLRDELIALRREFHRDPELGLHEYHTAARIERELDRCGIPHERVGETAVAGHLTGNGNGSGLVVLRADIDALPIQETNDVPYRSQTPGMMHACGHDAHTTCLLGAAKVLSAHRADFGGEVRFLFQPAEEIGQGARPLIAAGMLDGMGVSSLKGALMARGAREVARLIRAMGGNELSAYGLCHLGDYEATVFSKYSHNRQFGESYVKGEAYTDLAEGYYTVKAMMKLADRYKVDLPISAAVYAVLYESVPPKTAIDALFERSLKEEFV